MMKRKKWIDFGTPLMGVLFVFCSCMDDGEVCPPAGASIRLTIGNADEVVTRSVASTEEYTIEDAYVLRFSGLPAKYQEGEKVLLSRIADNGTQTPILEVDLIPNSGDKIVVLVNTGVSALPAGLTADATTVDDLDTLFPSTAWNLNRSGLDSGEGMPMYGCIDSWSPGTGCTMIRAVAKLQLVLNLTGGDVTGRFTAANLSYALYHIPVETKGHIVVPTVGVNIPAGITFHNTGLTQKVRGTGNPQEQTYYMPEYGSSTLAEGATVAATAWHANRPCLLVYDGSRYYRLDLYRLDGTAHKYIDLKRNTNIIVTITKVAADGYATATEALANEGGNMEYTVTVAGADKNNVTSNGQYALSTDSMEVSFFDNRPGDIVKFSVVKAPDATMNVSTVCVDLVDATKTTRISMPSDFSVGGVFPTVLEDGKKGIRLGALTASADFVLEMDALIEDQTALEALAGCYFRISVGNLVQYVRIAAVRDVAFYYGTANCLELPSVAGTYSCDVTPYTTSSAVYDFENIPDNELARPRSAQMLWSDVSNTHVSGMSIAHHADGTHTLTYQCTGEPGNAVIAVYNTEDPTDANRKVLWSFHVWVSNRSDANNEWYSVTDLSKDAPRPVIHNKYEMMDRNLGATSNEAPSAANSNSNAAYGLLYEWGRKDPFVGGSTYNGNVQKTLYKAGSGTTKWTTTHVNETPAAAVGTVAYAVTHPMEYLFENVNGNWLYDAANISWKDDALWGNPKQNEDIRTYPKPKGIKSIYDPCPAGYQVPPQDTYLMVMIPDAISLGGQGASISGGTSYNTNPLGGERANYNVGNEHGLYVYYEQVLSGAITYIPAAGTISYNGGTITNTGINIFHWLNCNLRAVKSFNATRFSVNGTSCNPMWYGGRSQGSSIRCVRSANND